MSSPIASTFAWRATVALPAEHSPTAAGALAFATLIWMTAPAACLPPAAWTHAPARAAPIEVDWQDPESLPPRFRNHCVVDIRRGRSYCSNHCGLEYQFYYCSPKSFGCCHVGYGYCDGAQLLRCAP